MELSKYQIGNLIKKARNIKSEKIGKRYTQAMLANDINKSQGYIGDIESGRSYPTINLLSKIAVACNLPLSFFAYEFDCNNPSDLNDLSQYDTYFIETIPNDHNSLENYQKYLTKTKNIHNSLSEKKQATRLNNVNRVTQSILNGTIGLLDDNYLYEEYTLEISNELLKLISTPNLTLNGHPISTDVKISLENSIKQALDFATLLQNKELELNKNSYFNET